MRYASLSTRIKLLYSAKQNGVLLQTLSLKEDLSVNHKLYRYDHTPALEKFFK